MVNHTFLSNLSPAEIRQGMRELSQERIDAIVGRCFPGQQVAGCSSVSAALKVAGADFIVEKVPMKLVLPSGDEPVSTKRVALVRLDTGGELGSCGPNYGIIQNAEAFAPADVLIGEGKMDLRSVQVWDGGARVRLFGLLGSSAIEQGSRIDTLAHFASFEAAHDGIHGATGQLMTIRLVCFNGMTSRETAGRFTVRHTSRAVDRVKEAQAELLSLQRAAIEEAACLQDLAKRQMRVADARAFFQELLDATRGVLDEDATERQIAKRDRDIEALEGYFLRGEGNEGVSAYDAYNAVTEWLTPRRDAFASAKAFAKKFESAAIATGHGAKVKARAMKILAR